MHLFYPRYHAQSFYRNTFLVNRPQEIARAEKSDHEWNNIAESGCHFTCMAMIGGVDPATLADAAILQALARQFQFALGCLRRLLDERVQHHDAPADQKTIERPANA